MEWRLEHMKDLIKKGDIDAISYEMLSPLDGGAHCCHEFEASKRGIAELVRLAKLGQKYEKIDWENREFLLGKQP